MGPADLVAKIDNGMRPSTSDPSKHHVGPSNEKDIIALSNKWDSRVCLGT